MFFKRAKQDKRKVDPPEPAKAAVPAPAADSDVPGEKVETPPDLSARVDPKSLGFETTAELDPTASLVGQTRALEALDFGIGIKGPAYNILAVGPAGSGRRSAVRAKLEAAAGEAKPPADWVYVSTFDATGGFRALKFPHGVANSFAEGMAGVIDHLADALPAAFGADDYETRRSAIEEEFRFGRDDALEALRREAEGQNIAILRTPAGIAVAPILEGKVVSIDVFNSVPESLRKEVEGKIAAVEGEIEAILKETPGAEKARRDRLLALNEQIAGAQVRAALEELKGKFDDVSGVSGYLSSVARDLVRNAGLFLSAAGREHESTKVPIAMSGDPRFARYRVHIMATGSASDGAPIVQEANPTYANLFGRVERGSTESGQELQLVRVRPGALHRANGGFLLLDARALLADPAVTRALRHALDEAEIRFDPPAEPVGVVAGEIPDLEPIPLNLKVVVFGDAGAIRELASSDPEFRRLFKVEAVFDDTVKRSSETVAAYARLIAGLVELHELKPFDVGSVALLIDEAGRRAGGNGRLSLEVGHMADICREADHRAGNAGRSVTSIADIEQVLQARKESAAESEGGSAA